MSLHQTIESLLRESLAPLHLRLVNESHLHGTPAGAETHWNLIIVSQAFEGHSLIERHRAVYSALGEQLRAKRGIHALTMKTLTPTEWEQAGRQATHVPPSCLHGQSGGEGGQA